MTEWAQDGWSLSVDNTTGMFSISNNLTSNVKYGNKYYGRVKKLLPAAPVGTYNFIQTFYTKGPDGIKRYLVLVNDPLPSTIPPVSYLSVSDAQINVVQVSQGLTCSSESLTCNMNLKFGQSWQFLPAPILT